MLGDEPVDGCTALLEDLGGVRDVASGLLQGAQQQVHGVALGAELLELRGRVTPAPHVSRDRTQEQVGPWKHRT